MEVCQPKFKGLRCLLRKIFTDENLHLMSHLQENLNLEIIEKYLPGSHLLSQKQKELLVNNVNVVRYRRKDMIFRQDARSSHIMFVKSGMIKIFRENRDGRAIVLKLAVASDYLCLMSVFADKVQHFSATAVTDAEICDIDASILKSILLENSPYAQRLHHLLSMEGLFIFDRLMGQTHKQLPGRVADLLLYFSEEVFKNEVFILPLTRKELAEFAGTTKESFIRTLREFSNDKIIDIKGAEIRIRSMDIIKTLSLLG